MTSNNAKNRDTVLYCLRLKTGFKYPPPPLSRAKEEINPPRGGLNKAFTVCVEVAADVFITEEYLTVAMRLRSVQLISWWLRKVTPSNLTFTF